MQRPLLVSLGIILALGAATAQRERSARDNARQYFINGTALQLQGNRHAEAILEFQQALRYDSASATLTAMARSYFELRKLTLAEEIVRMSLERDSASGDSWELLAEILISNGRYDEGVAAYEHVLYHSPSNRQIYTMARLYEPRDARKAIVVFERLAKSDPNPALYVRIAALYERVRERDKAIATLEKANALDPDQIEVASELVRGYLEQGKLDDALALVRKWYATDPFSQQTRSLWTAMLQAMAEDTMLVNIYADTVRSLLIDCAQKFRNDAYVLTLAGANALNINEVKLATRLFDEAAALVSDRPDPLLQMGGLIASRGLTGEALHFVSHWRPKHYTDPRFTLFIADCLYRLEKEDQAEKEYVAALELDSTLIEAWLQIAQINENKNDLRRMKEAYEHVLAIEPDNMIASNNYAYSITTFGGDLQYAKELSWVAVQQNPTNAAYLDTYAWVLYKSGDNDKALVYIKRAVESGGNATHYEHWGDILEANGDIDGAVRAWNEAMDRDPSRTYLRSRIDRFR